MRCTQIVRKYVYVVMYGLYARMYIVCVVRKDVYGMRCTQGLNALYARMYALYAHIFDDPAMLKGGKKDKLD